MGLFRKRNPQLTKDERELLWQGLAQWGGPTSMTNDLAVALGFHDATHFYEEAKRIRRALASGEQLDTVDVRRALAATEICFASDTLGAACDWEEVTGMTDEATLSALRELQGKVLSMAKPR